MTSQQKTQTVPPQHQNQQPGIESDMNPQPKFQGDAYHPGGKLHNKVALITGGDSGIGRAVAVAFAKEGAHVAISYLNEDKDAALTKAAVEEHGVNCILLPGDIGEESICQQIVEETVQQLGHIDILVNNAAEQQPKQRIEDISSAQLERTFRTNIFAMFYMVKAAMSQLRQHKGVIINTASVTAYKGSANLLDYSATKGAIVAFTRSLSANLVKDGVRVNGVAPGPIWTPLIPSTAEANQVSQFGSDVPMKRPGQPEELAPAYVYLACQDSSYVTGQMIHINGGEVVNG
ncbi:SDR family oxidoreductase [Paenibacillus aquistagni]|uniref:SDR family oxidoreductase n=1 Tax=Paenibacillus aquistagni TaxID=1852522 RepID=UPI000B5063E6|nr:SDR family oxidoreductase [Paenibacillus aquistagni]